MDWGCVGCGCGGGRTDLGGSGAWNVNESSLTSVEFLLSFGLFEQDDLLLCWCWNEDDG